MSLMWPFQKKKKVKKLKRGAIPYVFLLVGFFGATLTDEVINILHEIAIEGGPQVFFYHSMGILIAWVLVVVGTMKMIEGLYEE